MTFQLQCSEKHVLLKNVTGAGKKYCKIDKNLVFYNNACIAHSK